MSTGRAPHRALDLETIIGAASELIEAEGFAALTMRRLAERCGVTAMSLYRYVRTKDDLLVLLANRALEDLQLPAAGTLGWEEEITTVFRALHELLLAHPEFAQISASQPIDALVAFRGMELVLGTLLREGLSDQEAVSAYDALVSFTRGFNRQHAGQRAQATSAFERLSTMRELHDEEFPHVVRLAGLLVTRDPGRHYDEGLAVVIGGIAAQIAARRRSKP
jgi:AcrR family transcriptional regulator